MSEPESVDRQLFAKLMSYVEAAVQEQEIHVSDQLRTAAREQDTALTISGATVEGRRALAVAIDGHLLVAVPISELDPSALADLHGERIQPHVGVGGSVEGPGAERLDGLVQALGEGRNLRLLRSDSKM